MSRKTNRQIQLAARPEGFPKGTDFRLVELPIPPVAAGQFLVRSIFLSVDPYMRGRMNDRKSYVEPQEIDRVMGGGVVGEVVESQNEKFNVGDVVLGMFGWQEYAVSDGKEVRVVKTGAAPSSTALGVLGMPGLTAYCGFLDICNPQAGETVVVSGAAGAVGSVVGQIAKIKGCRVVGVAGTDAKVAHLVNDLGFDAAMNYKNTDDYYGKLKELCPAGIDCYFDNVGGPITDAVFGHLNEKGRIAICGQISQYNAQQLEKGPRLLWKLIEKQAKVEGFLVFQYVSQFRAAKQQLSDWVESGELKYRERIVEGLENAPRAFFEMLQGENIGKQLVKISEPSV